VGQPNQWTTLCGGRGVIILRRNGVYNVADRAREVIDGATRDAVGAERWPVFRGVGYIAVGSAERRRTETRERLRATPPDIPRHAETVGRADQTAEPRGPQPSPGRIRYGLGSADTALSLQ